MIRCAALHLTLLLVPGKKNEMEKCASQPRGTCLSLPCGILAVTCLLTATAASAFGQHISVGIKGGVPLTDVVEAGPGGDLGLPFQAQTKRYTIGPVVDIRLPLGFGVEFGAMYKRLDQQSQTITTTGSITIGDTGYPIQQRANISAVGHSWEFPIAVQYHFFKSAIRPYVEGGVSFNHLSNVYGFQNLVPIFPNGPRSYPFTIGPTSGSFDRTGGLFGLGVDLKLHVIHVTPGLRYTHYNDTRFWLPSTNAADFLVGITF